MAGSGSGIFSTPDAYEGYLPGSAELFLLRRSEFHARLTRVGLPGLTVFRAREQAARVAQVVLRSDLVLVSFITHRASRLLVDGATLQIGQIFLHGTGEGFHQRTLADCRWGAVSLTARALAESSQAIAGRRIEVPRCGVILSPGARRSARFLHQHARVGRIAERTLDHVVHQQVARALEQDLLLALIDCLAVASRSPDPAEREPGGSVLARLEAIVATNSHRLLETAEIAGLLGIPEDELDELCDRALGMGPEHYQRLRRLRLVRTEVARNAASGVGVAEIAQRFGFADLRRFTADYLEVYGEFPPFSRGGVIEG